MPLRLNLIRIFRVEESRNLPLHGLVVGLSATLLGTGDNQGQKESVALWPRF